jgi:hypothetical protein
VVKIASTTGGFLIGFGLCLLLLSFGASAVLSGYYSQIMAWKDKVELLYQITHSSTYKAGMDALTALSPYANQIADAVGLMPGLNQLAVLLRQISGAASSMRSAYDASESAYYAIQVVGVAPQSLLYVMCFSIFLIVVGVVLVVRARRIKAST